MECPQRVVSDGDTLDPVCCVDIKKIDNSKFFMYMTIGKEFVYNLK